MSRKPGGSLLLFLEFLPSISISSGSLSCCSPAFCCCCWVWWWWFMFVISRLLPSSSWFPWSGLGSVAKGLRRAGGCRCGSGLHGSGRACADATSAFPEVGAGEWGRESGGGAGRETRTYLLAIRPISAPFDEVGRLSKQRQGRV